jgi:hypothetical protein
MKNVEIKNIKLKKLLNNYSSFLLQDKFKEILNDVHYYGIYRKPYEKGITKDYLEHVSKEENKQKYSGFPESIKGLSLQYHDSSNIKFLNETHKLLHKSLLDFSYETTGKINTLLVTKRNALCCYYPDDGYITWHNNQNASGHNVIFSYSEKGTGSFSYLDPATKEIVDMKDPVAEWTCKVGYFGKYTEPDKVFWHKAESGGSKRITVAFMIPSHPMWNAMINDIESP